VTALNPEKCGSFPVSVEDKVEAYEIFTTLRGDIVNPRSEPARRTPSTSLRVDPEK
jgi:DNA gyrase/topoisomerase IV subunit B